MVKKSKKKILVSVISLGACLVLLGVSAFVFFDYHKFNNYERSIVFGSKNSYPQNKPLYFDDIKVTVTAVEHKKYDYQTYEGCLKIAKKAGAELRGNNFVKTDDWHMLSFQSEHCNEMADLYETKKMIVVHFFVENLTDGPLDMKSYAVKLIGDNVVEKAKPEKNITTLSSKQSRYDNFVVHHVNRKSEGPYALTVTKNGRQKEIKLNLPAIKPFCDFDVCKKEVYSR